MPGFHSVHRLIGSASTKGSVARWGALVVLSLIAMVALEAGDVPAALLLGPMLAAVLIVTLLGRIPMPRWPVLIAQGVVGCLIARNISYSIVSTVLDQWPLFAVCVVAVIVTSFGIGSLLAHLRVLPWTTAAWGSAPGGASAMTLMAQSHGADHRLVAIMQYLRVALVALVASIISRLLAPGAGPAVTEIVWFTPITESTLFTVLVILAGVALGRILRIPSGGILVPLTLGGALQAAGILVLDLPPWLLAVSYAVIGWNIGSGFTRQIIAHAARVLPQIMVATIALIAICGGFAAILHATSGIDPLTAYLATSPGGADTVAIIAAASPVDTPFVMAMQVTRMVVILLVVPPFSRSFSRP